MKRSEKNTNTEETSWLKAFTKSVGWSKIRRLLCTSGQNCRIITNRWAALSSQNHLLDKAKVAVSPGVGFGEYGEGFVRIALIENVDRIRQALRGIKKMFIEDGLLETASHKRQSVTRRWKGAHMPSEAEANAKPKVTLKPEEVPHITTKSEGLKKKGKKVTVAKSRACSKRKQRKRRQNQQNLQIFKEIRITENGNFN